MVPITSIEETKQIGLDILSVVHEYCMEHHIMYSLACGTLIGAARHKGFIPWDDDVDIYMLRRDYNIFLKSFPGIYKNIAVASLERSGKWNRAYAKAYDTRTIVMEAQANNIEGIGFGIDIFPVDDAPDSLSVWEGYERKRKMLVNLYVLKSLNWRKGRKITKNVFSTIGTLLLAPFSYRYIARRIDTWAQHYNHENQHYLAENCYGVPNNRFPKECFNSTIEMPFEDRAFCVMSGYDTYLGLFYGDYMKLPPMEKQVTHHVFHVYWKK